MAVTLAVFGTAASGCGGVDEATRARTAAQTFLEAWSSQNYDAAGAATDAPEGPREWLPAVDSQLGEAKVRFALRSGSVTGDEATQQFTVSWSLPGQEERWSYPSSMRLRRAKAGWKVKWDVSIIHPDLAPNLRFGVERALPERAAVLDRSGQPLFTKQPVANIGLEPRKAGDLPQFAAALVRALAPAVELDPAQIIADAGRAKPDAFVPVVALRLAQYEQIKTALQGLPGVHVRPEERLLTPTARFGQPLLGRVGPVTAEVLKEGLSFATGDIVGLSGLQRAFNKQLAGAPAVKVSLIDSAAKPVKELAKFAARPGEPLKTTVDQAVQSAAEAALGGVSQPAAIVAIKPSTGEVVAVANSAAAPFNIALEGKYPPGSTFKVVSATALLQARIVQPDGAVPCPASVVSGGTRFGNANKFDLGTVPLRTAFARSCNTTFISLTEKLPDDALARTAGQFGFGANWRLPVTTFSGSVPPPQNAPGRAADAIGQGTVLASPFAMAMVAATLQSGVLRAPSLVVSQPTELTNPPPPLAAAVLDPVRQFARAVVTEGTATSLARHGELFGKTGTAEYGTENPPRAHSWFIGYRGDLAFAVFVHDGASANVTATAVTGAFLKALPAGGIS